MRSRSEAQGQRRRAEKGMEGDDGVGGGGGGGGDGGGGSGTAAAARVAWTEGQPPASVVFESVGDVSRVRRQARDEGEERGRCYDALIGACRPRLA